MNRAELRRFLKAEPEVVIRGAALRSPTLSRVQVCDMLKLPERMTVMASSWGSLFEKCYASIDADGSDAITWEELCAHFRHDQPLQHRAECGCSVLSEEAKDDHNQTLPPVANKSSYPPEVSVTH